MPDDDQETYTRLDGGQPEGAGRESEAVSLWSAFHWRNLVVHILHGGALDIGLRARVSDGTANGRLQYHAVVRFRREAHRASKEAAAASSSMPAKHPSWRP